MRCPKTFFRHCNLAIKTNGLVVCPDAPRLTEDGQLHRGLRLLVPAAGHALVDAGAALGGLVDDEEGGGFIVAADREVVPVGEDLLPARAVPVDLAGLAHHCGRRTASRFQFGSGPPPRWLVKVVQTGLCTVTDNPYIVFVDHLELLSIS